MPDISFCINCGSGLIQSSKFCGKCGHPVGNFIENDLGAESNEVLAEPNKEEINYGYWTGLAFAAVIGFSAFLSVIDLPADAGYVTFNLTVDNILNGGWYTWYSGPSAFSVKLMVESGNGTGAYKSGMDASTFRTILWIVIGLCVGMAWPAFKNGLRKFIKDVTN